MEQDAKSMERDHHDTNPQADGMERTIEFNKTYHFTGYLQKSVHFLLTKWLSYKLEEQQLLTGMNWVGLPGGRTIFPIIALNNMIEDTKDNNRRLWILLQNIRRAFDSVLLGLMKKSLYRLNFSELLIDTILTLVEN